MTWEQYATAWSALHGGFDPRAASPVVRGWVRLAYRGGSLLARLGAGPTAVTAAGCDTPIVPGVMPVLRMATIARSAQLSGAPFPPALLERFERLAGDEAAVRALGIELCSEMCRRLLDEGVPGIHFITLNRSTATREVWQQLSPSPAQAVAA